MDIDKRRKVMMNFFNKIVLMDGNFSLADKNTDVEGYLVYYTYDPLAEAVIALERLFKAIKVLMENSDDDCWLWEVNFFGPDGLITCSPDGRKTDEKMRPIEGSSIF